MLLTDCKYRQTNNIVSQNKPRKLLTHVLNTHKTIVQIVISNHWASEGVWVEASETKKKLSPDDHLYRQNYQL